MRTVAQYAFEGAAKNSDEAKQLFEESCQAVESWLADKGELDTHAKTLHLEDGRTADCEIVRTTCTSGATAKWTLAENSGASRFSTTLELANAREEVALSCVLSTGFIDAAIAPRPFTARCPKVLRDILGLRPGWRIGVTDVPSRAVKCSDAAQVGELVGELLSPDRALPIIVVASCDGFLLHPNLVDVLCSDICGLGIVAQLNDTAAWELTKKVGKEWSCYNGAIRIYWPHLDTQSNPRNHPLWTSERLMQRAEGTEHASRRIRNSLRKRLFSISAFAVEPPPLFGRIESERARRLFQARAEFATTAGEYKELAQEYATENDGLRQQLQQERERVRQLREDLYRIQLTNAWADTEEEIAPVEDTPPDSVGDAVERAKRDYAQQLTFGDDVADGVQSLARNAGPPDKILEYLRVLAIMVDQRRGEGLGENPIQWLQKNGVSASTESEMIQNNRDEMKKRTWHDGRNQRKFLTHLKPSEAAHPDRCVRIYFDWDDASAKIVVGWVGRHP
ncbi:MAG TPA: hypothetical protein VI454_10770 [Verrucomicrobiae bacterium]|jgi:hypothetical protein